MSRGVAATAAPPFFDLRAPWRLEQALWDSEDSSTLNKSLIGCALSGIASRCLRLGGLSILPAFTTLGGVSKALIRVIPAARGPAGMT